MNDYTHILAAIDFSSSADLIVSKASDLAKNNNARLSLLHVVEYIPPVDYENYPMLSHPVIDTGELVESARQSLQNICNKHQLVNAGTSVMNGTPKHEISRYVEQHQCDLIVIGSHGRHGLSLLLGSTANAVLHAMPCDILTIKIDE